MRFEKGTARELEGQLSEMIHQRRIQSYSQQGNWHEPPSQGQLLTIAPMYLVDTETKRTNAANKYAYDSSVDRY
jgi:hypothetical protein